jgi:hypothetical protein
MDCFLTLIGVCTKKNEGDSMKSRVQRTKKVGKLAPAYQQQLTSYALAAAAAGVSVLALTVPSQGEIVYKRAHQVIGDGASFNLDLTGDKTVDLTIANKRHSHCTTDGFCSTSQYLNVKMAGTNQVVYNVYGAVAMKPGMQIGPRNVWRGGVQHMASILAGFGTGGVGGSWVNVNSRYLGVKFDIKGQTHFGWARLNVQIQLPLTITATLTGYAYETIANKAITAGQTKGPKTASIEEPDASLTAPSPQPATLGPLAAGAPGLSIWRREHPAWSHFVRS